MFGEFICQGVDAGIWVTTRFVVRARDKRSQDESNTWNIFTDVYATSRRYE
jgi:hypothetical protein